VGTANAFFFFSPLLSAAGFPLLLPLIDQRRSSLSIRHDHHSPFFSSFPSSCPLQQVPPSSTPIGITVVRPFRPFGPLISFFFSPPVEIGGMDGSFFFSPPPYGAVNADGSPPLLPRTSPDSKVDKKRGFPLSFLFLFDITLSCEWLTM